MTIIDARGLSCPQPVLMAKQALEAEPTGCEILVDNAAAQGNVSRFAQKAGYSVTVSKDDSSDIRLIIKK